LGFISGNGTVEWGGRVECGDSVDSGIEVLSALLDIESPNAKDIPLTTFLKILVKA
jgi:hypothetical protein